MTTKSLLSCRAVLPTLLGAMLVLAPVAHAAESDQAKEILAATGVKGGVIVHIGCGEGGLTTALRANASYLVQGLDADAAKVEKARQQIRAQNLYGPVSVEPWKGPLLPYNDNLVNLVVAENLGGVSMGEVMRVLAPNGVAYIRKDGQWTKTVKPRPADIDDWTHYLHDSSNNAVAHDKEVGPPRQMQWLAGPRYSRHHDHMSSISAMVTANGRTFDIFDEAPRASIITPSEWFLTARDAFNGTLLWKRQIGAWHNHMWPPKSGPQILTRRLVAAGDCVYVTLAIDAPLTALDAATGETVRTYDETKATEEILFDKGVLFLSVAGPGQPLRYSPDKSDKGINEIKASTSGSIWTEAPRIVMAVDADSGKVFWKKNSKVVSMSLAADAQRVLFHDGEKIQCLDRKTGQSLWASAPLPVKSEMGSSSGATLVLYGDVVLYSGLVAAEKGDHTTVFALSIKDGKTLWKANHPPCGHMGTPDDILVANGLVWWGAVAQKSDSGTMTARDPLTGKVVKETPCDGGVPWIHHRCYRAKATDNFLMFSRTGIEYIATSTGHWTPNNWVRGGCLYGVMPANGMTYVTPHPCACYEESKLYGFTALAPAPKTPLVPVPDDARLEQGPAYGAITAPAAATGDWPTFRHDQGRSGSTKTDVSIDLKDSWQTTLGGKLSTVVVAEGKLFVASVETATVHALDADTGKVAWTFTAGGRVDSPPTIWQGTAIFGCTDGYIYCLRASDGVLAWRYLAAPANRQMVAYDQLESVWPVSGSVLVQDGIIFSVAGRQMFLDSGLRLVRLDAKTGRKLSETILNDQDPTANGTSLQAKASGMNMPVALSDILSCDGHYVYMRSLPFDLKGQRKFVEYVRVTDQKGDDIHLFSPTGFLDDSMWHRSYWVFGRAWASSAGGYFQAGRLVPAGRIMVFDDKTVWGYGRLWKYYKWSTPYTYHLFATSKQPEVIKMTPPERPESAGNYKATPTTRFGYEWSDDLPVSAMAMVHAGSTLFVVGPPGLIDEEEAVRALDDPKMQVKTLEQNAAYEGRKGAVLTAVSASDGKGLASYRLASMPNFDGMAAANGRLYCSTSDGKILCLGSDKGTPLPRATDVKVTPRGPDADKPLTSAAAQSAAGRKKKK